MLILMTGVAGFIGYHCARRLLEDGADVIGIDNLDPYYDVQLKRDRLTQLSSFKHFTFLEKDITHKQSIEALEAEVQGAQCIVHLAAQAGVRYSLTNPLKYAQTNMVGHLNMLELGRSLKIPHFVYASSSSVYGGNTQLPFSEEQAVDSPLSLYAATKRSAELMSYTYSHLFDMPCTGLRFFTVYGPWGRPDMAAFIFTKALMEDQELPVFHSGQMQRNFTYIDDIVQGTCQAVALRGDSLNRVYNLGNDRSEHLMDFVHTLENITGKKARINNMPLQPGDVPVTIADIRKAQQDLNFQPRTSIQEGLEHFVHWYREYSDYRKNHDRKFDGNS